MEEYAYQFSIFQSKNILAEFYFDTEDRPLVLSSCEIKMDLSKELILNKSREILAQNPITRNENKIYIINLNGGLEKFYIEVYLTKCFIPEYLTSVPSIRLFSIWIPESFRNCGLCTEILSMLIRQARTKNMPFVVGPVVTDKMQKLLSSNKFKRRWALDFYFI